ncbi:hypothetical protein Acsp06_14490 [Actinomycetospora sp. NBRC 106375]|uniref:DUF3099 domain-containing protein n=1 Tax=Actinomycetospora sp. NBRC 106375 TaxID=3032207 RepID=UPI0024A0B6F0|nr:hypothetical protein Acsp06_14490 [Actinomycetospora sp. NBRC 106375]
MNRRQDDDGQPILITEAAVSYDEEFAARKKRYSIIMACRIPCLLLAGVFGIAFQLPWVAVAFIVLSVPLPWVAVLIANDRPPKKSEKANRYRKNHRELGSVPDAQIIEAAEALDRRGQRTEAPRQARQDAPDHEPPHVVDTEPPPRTGSEG